MLISLTEKLGYELIVNDVSNSTIVIFYPRHNSNLAGTHSITEEQEQQFKNFFNKLNSNVSYYSQENAEKAVKAFRNINVVISGNDKMTLITNPQIYFNGGGSYKRDFWFHFFWNANLYKYEWIEGTLTYKITKL